MEQELESPHIPAADFHMAGYSAKNRNEIDMQGGPAKTEVSGQGREMEGEREREKKNPL